MVKVHRSSGAKTSGVVNPARHVAVPGRVVEKEPRDVIEISVAARLAAQLAEMPEVRKDLVARIKAEIRDGTYETEEKLQVAVKRLMEELGL